MNSFENKNGRMMSEDQKDDQAGSKTGVLTKVQPKTKKPSMYKVLMLNDDYTPMDFVVGVLLKYFQKSEDEAVQIMLNIHQTGVGLCGVYSFEIAETKVVQVINDARGNEHPLQCTLEKE